MAALDVVDAIGRTREYHHAVVSFVDKDGYPTSVAGDFRSDPAGGSVEIGPLAPETLPGAGTEVCVTFSHIRPQSGVGRTLLMRAAEYGSDLLVMGCYGHSRLREFVLGGASRHVLDHMTIPVLMSH